MSFHSPHLLWLLVPLVLLFSWELARHTVRAASNFPKIARAWAGAFDVSLGAKHTTADNRPRIWLWFGLAFCIVALARPQWGLIEEQVFDQSREVLIAVDLSKSMLAQDVKPSRLDRSKLLITSLLDGLKGERVGLVLFAGTAFLQSPLSADYEILREFLPSLNPGYLPEGGTNYRALIETSIQAFGTSTADRYLIVLSDGEATDEDWKSLVDSMKQKGIRVIGLGVGTTQGSFIPDTGGGFMKDERGAVVLSRLNSSTLQELAQITGGAYADASSWVDLPALLQKTVEAGRKGDFHEKNTARLMERFQWFLAPGLLLLLVSFWAEFPVRPRERALPLGKPRSQRPAARSQPVVATAILCLVCLSTLSSQLSALGAEGPQDTLAAPLSKAVARLAAKDDLNAKDFAELAQSTVTFGQRVESSQQHPVDGAIRDGLAAVDQGEKLDAKAADWPKLRADLEELRKKKEEEKKKQEEKQKEQQKKEQEQKDQQQQNQDQNQQDQPDQQKSEQQKQEQEQKQQQNKDAFGDMKDQKDKPPPKPDTQKVGGQQDQKPSEEKQNPDLAMPLQKLDQARQQDSPAKLFQMMQGKPEHPEKAKKGKDW